MSILAQYNGLVRSGRVIEITEAPEGETQLTVGTQVWAAGVDDIGRVCIITDGGWGEWRTFNPAQFKWQEV